MNITVMMLLSMAFAFSFCSLVCAKPLFLETPFFASQTFHQLSQANKTEPQNEVFEPEESISQESNITSDLNGFLVFSTAQNRTARSTHPCYSGMTKVYDHCRQSWVTKIECYRSHPACNHVIPIHYTPKCQTVYGFRNSKFVGVCPSLPLDCKCAS